MRSLARRSFVGTVAAAAALALWLTGCTAGDESSGPVGGEGCEAFADYGDLSGKSISVYTNITEPEDQQYLDTFAPFEECTGATVDLESSRDFEAQLTVRIQGGTPPDIALIPQPGLLANQVATGSVKKPPAAVETNIDKSRSLCVKHF